MAHHGQECAYTVAYVYTMSIHAHLYVSSNNVLLVKIEGPVWYTIYHHLPVVKGVCPNPSINQPTNGKRTSMVSSIDIVTKKMSTKCIHIDMYFFKKNVVPHMYIYGHIDHWRQKVIKPNTGKWLRWWPKRVYNWGRQPFEKSSAVHVHSITSMQIWSSHDIISSYLIPSGNLT